MKKDEKTPKKPVFGKIKKNRPKFEPKKSIKGDADLITFGDANISITGGAKRGWQRCYYGGKYIGNYVMIEPGPILQEVKDKMYIFSTDKNGLNRIKCKYSGDTTFLQLTDTGAGNYMLLIDNPTLCDYLCDILADVAASVVTVDPNK